MKILLNFLILFFCFTATAADCPNLSGFYWDVEGDKPHNGVLGRMMEIRQRNCENLEIYIHWVKEDNTVVYKGTQPYVWNLNGKRCDPEKTGEGIDCRAHTFDQKSIFTFENAIFKSELHGFCKYSQFSWKLDAKGILETTPSQCEDGYKGDLTGTLERAR